MQYLVCILAAFESAICFVCVPSGVVDLLLVLVTGIAVVETKPDLSCFCFGCVYRVVNRRFVHLTLGISWLVGFGNFIDCQFVINILKLSTRVTRQKNLELFKYTGPKQGNTTRLGP